MSPVGLIQLTLSSEMNESVWMFATCVMFANNNNNIQWRGKKVRQAAWQDIVSHINHAGRLHLPLCASQTVCKFFSFRVLSDFSLIREVSDTMWKSHERRGWGINNKGATWGESRCTVSATGRGFAACKGLARADPCVVPPPTPRPPHYWTYAMNSTTQPPPIIDGDVAVSYVLVPFFLITIIGIAAAVVSCWTGLIRMTEELTCW